MANFDANKAIFSLVDSNNDGSIDQNEFRNWLSGGAAGNSGSSSYQSSSGSFDASAGGAAGNFGSSAYQSSSGSFDASAGGAFNGDGSSSASHSGFESAAGAQESSYASSSEFAQASGASQETSSVVQKSQYPSAGGLYDDPNPQFIRREAVGGAVTYQQKIVVRFLQPPPVPPPGPLIIKEVRPPQPPPPPPLVVRQRAPPLPQPPPLILRERPPQPPAAVASQTITRRLAAIPVPPRSVVIERLPPLPPRPRDIIIERWIPYATHAKRRTIIQRAAEAKGYAKPRNIIIAYSAAQVRVVRQFQRFSVTQENPQTYVSRYGAALLDSTALVQQARAAGVVEDISPPAVAASQFSASSASQGFSAVSGLAGGAAYGLDGANSDKFSSQSHSSSSSYGSERGSGQEFASASFAAADTNHDGRLDQAEFQRFVQRGL